MSMPRAKSPQSYVNTSPVLNGIAEGGMRLRRRSSMGSRPSSRAATSITRSIAYVASGRPAPRYGPVGVVFVYTPVLSMWMAGVVYTPARPPTLLVAEKALATARRPLHRPAEALRGPEHQDQLRVDTAAHAEAAADLAGDHA